MSNDLRDENIYTGWRVCHSPMQIGNLFRQCPKRRGYRIEFHLAQGKLFVFRFMQEVIRSKQTELQRLVGNYVQVYTHP